MISYDEDNSFYIFRLTLNGHRWNIHRWLHINRISVLTDDYLYFYGKKAINFLVENGPLFSNLLLEVKQNA